MVQSNNHLSRAVVDNRDKQWSCEICHKSPDTVAVIMRGGYVQAQLCSKCYTDRYPNDQLMLDWRIKL